MVPPGAITRRAARGCSVIQRVETAHIAPFAPLPAASDARLGAAFRVFVKRRWPGARYHAVAEEGISAREIAKVVGAGLGLSVRPLLPDEVAEHMARLRTSLFSTSIERMDAQEAGLGADRPGLLRGPAARERGYGRCALMNG